ncbi:MAG TPA: hypothetical protein VFS31_12540 [Chitinophagaceae bacterium]|nr:hypothetical protein [Chitinophagaceae bacterium]
MFNPFPLLHRNMLKQLLEQGHTYFVRQHYPRGAVTAQQIERAFLIKGYMEQEKDLALLHIAQLKQDAYAKIYNAGLSADLEKLSIAAEQPAPYAVYYCGKTGSLFQEWKPTPALAEKIKNYIRAYYPHWKSRDRSAKAEVILHEKYGHLFLKLRFEEEEEWIPFELVENI